MTLARLLRTFALLASLPLAASARAQITEVGDGGPGPAKAEHLTVELVSLSPDIAIGGTQTIGLQMSMEEHWHVYWINAGDSGEPPTIKWTLPAGVTTGPLQFPAPTQLPLGPLMDFGYEDEMAFPITVTAAPSVKPGKIHLDAHISWLVCAQVCIPGKAHLGLDLDAKPGPLPAPQLVGRLGTEVQNLPKTLPDDYKVSAVTSGKQIALTVTSGQRIENAEIYPFQQDICLNGACTPEGLLANAAEQKQQPLPDGIRVFLTAADDIKTLPNTFHALIKISDTEAYEATVPLTVGTLPPLPVDTKKITNGATPSDITAISAIGLAFLGGIILNLMPCVFPVLFLKGLALVNSSGEEKSRQRAHGLVYTAGIVASFWAIVAVLLTLRASGHELGWGFQLQSPGFVAVLASLMFFLALSLAGQFELGLSLTSAGGSLAQKQGYAGSFFTGVLATAVATPCTAPLMGAAIGFALAQPAWLTFTVFTALALGLALPYLVLTLQPQWTSILPKPGAWMEYLKQFTSLFLFGSAIWLTWVYGQLYAKDGIDRLAFLLTAYLIIAIAGWALGKWPAKLGSTIAAIVLIAFAMYLPLHRPKPETTAWQAFSTDTFSKARASGNPIFIDFTAAWCLSCQVNERAVLHSPEVEKKLAAGHFQLLKADWTQYDPAITQLLGTLGRSGVPTYVIYPAGASSNPQVLPELLTKDIVLTDIEKYEKMGSPK